MANINLRTYSEKWALKKSVNDAVLENIKNTFEMEMDNEIFKQNNVGQVKNNATKLEYTIYGKNVNSSPPFMQNFLI